MPGDPVYGFPQVKKQGTPVLDVASKDLVGLAAKGNIIVGDYTSPAFKTQVLPNLQPGPSSKTQPYVVDPTDVDLGYNTGDVENLCKGQFPCFEGDYTVQDKDGLLEGTQTDGDKRLFYESTLGDLEFKSLVNSLGNMPTTTLQIDAVLYTNHAMAGFSPATTATVFNGSRVARDDGFIMSGPLRLNHDIRLLDGAFSPKIVLPMSISRPTIKGFQECPANSCPTP
jgi:hypothetical protein